LQNPEPRRRVLFIEDEPAIRLNYQRYFRDRLELAFAATGTEALVLLREFRPDAVVLDLHLPDTDGIQLLRRIHARNTSLPIIVTTGEASCEGTLQREGLAFHRFMMKPMALADLAAAIDALG